MLAASSVEIRKVNKYYAKFQALKDVDLSIPPGKVTCLIGPSGSGKSTLLRCINHLTPPDQGRVLVEGVEITSANLNKMREKLAFVFQDFNLFTHLRAVDNVAVGPRKIRGMNKVAARDLAMRELERVGMVERAEAYPAELSGGQQQRVSIARALAMEPKVILFDEPTSALDPELTGEVVAVMKQLASDGMTMLVVSHEIGFARQAADEIIFMDGGHILEQGPPEQLFASPQHERTRQFLSRIGEGGAGA